MSLGTDSDVIATGVSPRSTPRSNLEKRFGLGSASAPEPETAAEGTEATVSTRGLGSGDGATPTSTPTEPGAAPATPQPAPEAADGGPSTHSASPASLGPTTPTSEAASTPTGAKARPFLRKGSRMPRSTIPQNGATNVTKPVVNRASTPTSKKALHLHPRSADRGESPLGVRVGSSTPRRQDGRQRQAEASRDQRQEWPAPLGGDELQQRQSEGQELPSAGELLGSSFSGEPDQFRAPPHHYGDDEDREDSSHVQSDLRAPQRPQQHDGRDDSAEADLWADAAPWDCRGTARDLELDLSDEVVGAASEPRSSQAAFADGPPPTSSVVQSYFRSLSTPNLIRPSPSTPTAAVDPRRRSSDRGTGPVRHPHWEGEEAYSTLYGGGAGGGGGAGARRAAAPDRQHRDMLSPPPMAGTPAPKQHQEEERVRLVALDQQIQKYARENEMLKKLQAQAEQSERDIAREREKLFRELDAERQALHTEFDAEHTALRRERRRLSQSAERQRHLLAEDREAAEERKHLRERTEQLEEEMREKDRRWQQTVNRLQRQVDELTRKNRELTDEVKHASQQAKQAHFGSAWHDGAAAAPPQGRRSSSTSSTRGRRSALESGKGGAERSGSVGGGSVWRTATPTGWHQGAPTAAAAPKAPHAEPRSAAIATAATPPPLAVGSATERPTEVRQLDGRTERFFADGRHEVEFTNGLKKVICPDGQTIVLFQNGDRKEIHANGTVVYYYYATGAVQTTLADGTEHFRFADGQLEEHHADGSKDISFPNGTSKRIFATGAEEVTFADGTVRRTPPPAQEDR